MNNRFVCLIILSIMSVPTLVLATGPGQPGHFTASDGTSPNFVDTSWDAVQGAVEYRIEASTMAHPNDWFLVGNSATTHQWIFNAVPGTVYNYRVFPVGQYVQNAEYSLPDRGHRWGLPDPVLNLTATPLSNNRIGIDFGAVYHVTYYNVYRSEGIETRGCLLFYTRTFVPWFIDTAVQPGMMYSYSASAVTPEGRGECSPVALAHPGI